MSISHESVITFQNQLASIMDVLLKNAVCEITKLFETSLSEIHSINVTQREMEVCASKLKLQQAGKTPETEEEYSANSGSNKTEFETWDEHLCSGTIDVFGHFVSSDNENVTKTSTAVTDKQDGDSHSEDRDFEQRWNCDLWRDGENSSSEARITQTQPIQVKREIPETDSCCSACGKMPVSVGSLCTACTGFSHQGAHVDSQTSSLLQPESLEFREAGRKRPFTQTEDMRGLNPQQMPSRVTERHITIVRKGVFPALQQCRSCCRLVHCPFCKESVYKPKFMYHVKRHIQIHLKYGVHYGDYIICRCNLECRKVAHFHCLWCSKTILRKEDFLNHLTVCQEKSFPFSFRLGHQTPFPSPELRPAHPLPPPPAGVPQFLLEFPSAPENQDCKISK